MKLTHFGFRLLIPVAGILLLSAVFNAKAHSATAADANAVSIFTVITSDSAETQFMALVLSMQSARQGADIRILLCDQAGELALRDGPSVALKPMGRSPRELLEGLIERGVTVEVCAIFLPNRELAPEDLISGVGIARPDEVAAYMLQEGIRYFTF